jgi:4-hydroxy-tetrahydrodipicolinate synthase
MVSATSLAGKLIPAVPVPMNQAASLDEPALEAYISWMVHQPIGGVAVWAHTGRGLRLPQSVLDRVLKSWRNRLPSGYVLVAAAGAPPSEKSPGPLCEQAYSMACRAAELGAECLLVHPPVALRDRPDRDALIVRYHSRIADAGLPLVLFYLYEAAGGISYSPEVIAELLPRPEVLGIKIATLDSVITFQDIARLVKAKAPAKVVITGEDRFLPYSLMSGAQSALIGMAAACTKIQAELLHTHFQGRSREFLALSSLVDDLAQHTFLSPMDGYIQRMLWCLVHQQVIPAEAAHDPWAPPIDPAEFHRIGACIARLEAATRELEQDAGVKGWEGRPHADHHSPSPTGRGPG